MVMYGSFIQDFVKRTSENLELLRKQSSDDEYYEVTQLINSLLGLIVFTNERSATANTAFFEKDVNAFLEDDKFPVPRSTYKIGAIDEPNTVASFLRHMRNAIAHCRIEAHGNETIESIEFFDESCNGTKPKWRITLTIGQIDALIGKFTAAYLEE